MWLIGLLVVPGNPIRPKRSLYNCQHTHRLADVIFEYPGDRNRIVSGPLFLTLVHFFDLIFRCVRSGITLPPILFIPYLERESDHGALIVALWRAAQIVIGYVQRARHVWLSRLKFLRTVSLALSL